MDHQDDKTKNTWSLTRRQLAAGGAATVAAAALGARATGIDVQDIQALAQSVATPEAASDGFIEPPVKASKDGKLVVTLQAMQEEAQGQQRMGYSNSVPGPTLRFRPGDNVKVALVNALPEETNLHVHGLHVSPRDNSDNIFIHIWPGQTFGYEFDIPDNHPPGTYWYHPHPHGYSNEQVASGMAGVIIIEGGLDDLPELQDVKERLLALQGPFKGANNQLEYTVNGQVNPTIPIRPGETQRWRIANISSNQFFNLQLVGHQLHRIAIDGYPVPEVQTLDIQLLGPGERAEVLIQGGAAGIYELRSLAWAPDIPSQAQPEFVVATVVSGGEPMEPAPLPTTLLPVEDLSEAEIDERRVVTFQGNQDGLAYAIDGKAFVEDRVDQTVKLGATEEWVIRNDSPEWHPFHIHVNDFQVMSVNGTPAPPHYEDTTLLPPHGEVVIRSRFLDFTGRFVYHCHILVHEDAGMMAVVEVVE